ncbi:hypothetical protein AMATHDRAFT_77974 [Amanita thiersii Skay4041]|uniref:Protein farnesyltransferase subunit beta n=1 Tax=Amanita thiersii Skay4041 TaxID=703135 RepID=A0A2A9N6X9_9AGAR|nr:hypothetical protein AMATHDRAFT_77974 [Amanita thiersii Skay4041]
MESPTTASIRFAPSPIDGLPTTTSYMQAETEEVLLKHVAPSAPGSSPPTLDKRAHMQYLIRNLIQGFPSRYISQDASQPWLLFWTLQSFSILQVGLDPGNKERTIKKVLSLQHPDGGFGGGPGQSAHLLPTYAAVCTLAIAGRPGPDGGWDQIDRKKMYNFFMSLKQKDGSFLVAKHAEVDVRGIYCLLVTATLLDMLTPELVAGTAEFIASCQTYEGGFSSSSQPYFSVSQTQTPSPSPSPSPSLLLPFPRPSLGEAHGGYTFCSLASWVALRPMFPHIFKEQRPSIDTPNLLRWLTHMQGNAIEVGGFRGRTNKLVDGCYSWWCGGCFPLLEALDVCANDNVVVVVGGGGHGQPNYPPTGETAAAGEEGEAQEEVWDDVDDALYSRIALQEYILYAGQHPAGGLRDKPPKNPDAYHTLYCLSGLSSAQHHVKPSEYRRAEILKCWKPSTRTDNTNNNNNNNEDDDGHVDDDIRKDVFSYMLCWTEDESGSDILGGSVNRLNATHPVTNLTMSHTEAIMSHFYGQTLPNNQSHF